MEQSVGTATEDRIRIQLHSTEASVTIVSLRRELEEARAGALTTRTSEEAARLQISHMLDEQLSQSQTIDSLRRQVELSNTALQQAQALFRANQEQPSRMPQPNNHPSGAGGVIGNTPFVPPLSTPSTGLCTRALTITTLVHRQIRGTRNICVLCLAGMIFVDLPRQEPPRQEQQSMGSSSRGSSSHYSHPNLGWQSRLGQSVPASPGSRIIPTRRVDPRDAQVWFGQHPETI